MKTVRSKEIKVEKNAWIYPIFDRIPPLLSEAKVGDECQLFLLKPLTISKIYAIIDT